MWDRRGVPARAQRGNALNDLAKNVILWIVIAVVLLTVFQSFGPNNERVSTIPYSTFLSYVENGSVEEVTFDNETIRGRRSGGEPFRTYNPETDNTALIGTLQEHGVVINASPPQQQSFLLQLFISSFPILLLIGVWVYFMRQMQGAGGGRGAMHVRLPLAERSIPIITDDYVDPSCY